LFDVVFDDAVILMLGFVDKFETLGVAVVAADAAVGGGTIPPFLPLCNRGLPSCSFSLPEMLLFILDVTDGDEANPDDAVRAIDTGIHTATQHRPMAVIPFRRGKAVIKTCGATLTTLRLYQGFTCFGPGLAHNRFTAMLNPFLLRSAAVNN